MSIKESQKTGCTFGAECSAPHWKVEEQPNRRPKKGGDKKCRGFNERCADSWVVCFKTQSRRNLYRFYGRAQKSWDQSDKYDSQEATQCHEDIQEK